MNDLQNASDAELENELKRRGKEVTNQKRVCTGCRNWYAVYHSYAHYYQEWHCVGCNRPENDCTCSR